ncbi:DUF1365 domain-containing protein [Gellertiella hungarica]|uniref:DUF1365 domain-containing protein n=1 Tax=Gellertiella hungarica TaxID=1572859 RepID=A0A7W6J585_9HYPH|nr:DUF1365 domain-containing protein [Gellertiella hungarica]MBB4065010.1 hypothetical protein [Gellertiella hungarica]
MTALPDKGIRLSRNGPAPSVAACIYEGQVMHQRLKPFGHRFNYRVFSLMIDLDRLEEADGLARGFSVNRFNWVAFHERDHLDEGETDLARTARRRFREGGVTEPLARILLVSYPRVLGKVFNPLAVYYGYDAEGELRGMTYEVRNTFGGLHRYVCPVVPGAMSEAGLRQQADKIFRVSPFVEMNMRYHFRMLPPGEEVRWRILETDPEGPLLSATFAGSRRPLDAATLLRVLARVPLLPITVLGGIHWEALKIWLKGAKFIPESKKVTNATDSSQLPSANFHPRLEPDAAGSRSTSGDGHGLRLQLKR